MGLKIYDTLTPQGDFPAVKAGDVLMPDGSRLSDLDLDVTPPVLEGVAEIEPEKYYEFGEVSELAVTLAARDDGRAHLYQFEFVPAEGFVGLTITPEPAWCNEPQYPVGKRVLVAVQMGMAVMGVA